MWASLILWKSQGYSLEVNGLKQEKPTVTAVTLQLKDHARDVTHALAYHPTMRCKSSKNHVLNRRWKRVTVKSFRCIVFRKLWFTFLFMIDS